MLFDIYSKWSWMSGIECDTSGNSNSSFHVGANIVNVFLYDFFIFFHV